MGRWWLWEKASRVLGGLWERATCNKAILVGVAARSRQYLGMKQGGNPVSSRHHGILCQGMQQALNLPA